MFSNMLVWMQIYQCSCEFGYIRAYILSLNSFWSFPLSLHLIHCWTPPSLILKPPLPHPFCTPHSGTAPLHPYNPPSLLLSSISIFKCLYPSLTVHVYTAQFIHLRPVIPSSLLFLLLTTTITHQSTIVCLSPSYLIIISSSFPPYPGLFLSPHCCAWQFIVRQQRT